MPSPRSLIQRVDAALADLTNNGGRLPDEVADKFILELFDAPTILNAATHTPMKSPVMRLPRLGLQGQFLMADPGDDTAIASGDRSAPQTFQTTLTAQKYQGQAQLPTTWLEDNIEREGFMTSFLTQVAKQCAVDLAAAAYHGDTTNANNTSRLKLLHQQDGWLKMASSHVVDAGSTSIDEDLMAAIVQTMPDKYIAQDNGDFTIMLQKDVALDWRRQIARRIGALAEEALTKRGLPDYAGFPVWKDNVLQKTGSPAVAQSIFTSPKNLVVGVHREITVKHWEDIQKDMVIIVVTTRVAFGMYQPDAAVRVDNIKPIPFPIT
jgi:hypothetical protein